MPKQTDNANLPAMLDLRRHFLRKYHADGSARVMDCGAGNGRVWFQLRREIPVASYWAFESKVRRMPAKVTAAKILSQPGWSENVIDISGQRPWETWRSILMTVAAPLTVFITLGRGGRSPIRITGDDLLAIGLSESMVEKLSGSLVHRLLAPVIKCQLGHAAASGCRIIEALEAACGNNQRLFGIRLDKVVPSPS